MTTPSSKSPSPRTSSTTSKLRHPALFGLAAGLGAGLLMVSAAGLNPLAASDRPALALLAVSISLPLGALLSRRPESVRDAGGLGLAAVVAALLLAASVCLFEPALFVRTASWCVAAALLGVSVGSIGRGAGVAATAFWLLLCGLPFFYWKLPVLGATAETWALQGCPWLGFAQDAIGGDPLRRPVLYLGHWSKLSDATGLGMLEASTLWLAAAPAFAALIAASWSGLKHEQTQNPAVMERAGA
jgi:hypothetical protein